MAMGDPDKDDNAPKPDMNPMIDVVFQLLVFFLVTMKFKTLDMKIEAFLPKDKGLAATIQEPDEKPKVVAVLKRRPGEPVTRVKVANITLGDTSTADVWARLTGKAKETLDRHLANGGDVEDVSGEVDAASWVPTGTVVRAVDAFVAAGINNVTFVGTPPPNSAVNQAMKNAATGGNR